jgi:hypothetical protein
MGDRKGRLTAPSDRVEKIACEHECPVELLGAVLHAIVAIAVDDAAARAELMKFGRKVKWLGMGRSLLEKQDDALMNRAIMAADKFKQAKPITLTVQS